MTNPEGYGKVCKHGQLARSCEICELEQEVESLKSELQEWKNSRDGFLTDMAELTLKYENSKCCGNCKHNQLCSLAIPDTICDKWVSDSLTRKEREG